MVDNQNYEIDTLDKQILRILTQDARVPYTEMAKKFGVSLGTIHVRIEKMRKLKIITEIVAQVDIKKIGYDIICFLGIGLVQVSAYNTVFHKLHSFQNIIEIYHTTGQYAIFLKLAFRTTEELYKFLTELEKIDEISKVDPFFSVEDPVIHNIKP